MLAPCVSTRQRPGWSVIVVVLLLLVPCVPALARSTPVASPVTGTHRLYVGHDARLTAKIPADWGLDRSLRGDYRGRDGFILSQSLWVDTADSDSVPAQCDIVAGIAEFEHAGDVEATTWRDQEACRVTHPGGDELSPVGLVFTHPEPATDGYNRYVLVLTDAGHFDAIVDSISFDPTLVTPRAYLDGALDAIETAWLWRADVDWDELRQDALEVAGDLSATDDLASAHLAIDLVIDTLSTRAPDEYAFFATPEMMAGGTGSAPSMEPFSQSLPGGIGFVVVTGSYDSDQSTQYAREMQAAIEARRDAATCGWILDLRGNMGGNLYAMIGGLLPLVEPGSLLGFRDAAGTTFEVELTDDGMITYDGQPLTWVASWFGRPDARLAAQPIAILVDGQTASSGEMLTAILRSQPGTRVFGEPTYGLMTSPLYMSLYDGAVMQFSSAWATGPLGATYPEGLTPDVLVDSTFASPDPADDDAVQAASAWLLGQPGCSATTATQATRAPRDLRARRHDAQ